MLQPVTAAEVLEALTVNQLLADRLVVEGLLLGQLAVDPLPLGGQEGLQFGPVATSAAARSRRMPSLSIVSRALRLAPPVSTGTRQAVELQHAGAAHGRRLCGDLLGNERLVGPGQLHQPVGDGGLLAEGEQVAVIEPCG